MKTANVNKFCDRLDEIFEQGDPTKAQIIDAFNKFSGQSVPEMFEFNINHYVYIQINEHGWKHLKTTVGDDYIKHCIVSHKEIINGEDWYKLQCHEVFSLFPVRGNPVPFNTNIIISWKELTELAKKLKG